MRHIVDNARGAVLGITIMTALICGIAAYAVLQASVSEARHTKFMRGRTEARYLAEAAIVIAREKLWNEAAMPYPPGCTGGAIGTTLSTPEAVDTDGDGVGDINVGVTVTNCGPGNHHAITASHTY